MTKTIGLAFAVAVGGACLAQEPPEFPGNVVVGPGGYFQKGDAVAGRGRGAGRAGRGGGVTTVSVRPADGRQVRTTVTGLLGWGLGPSAEAFPGLTFAEAAAKVDALGFAAMEGSATQKVSAEIPKNLDAGLSTDEVAKVRTRLSELRLRMPAYHLSALPADETTKRALFQFAKSLGVETIVTSSARVALPEVDKLANETGINVAFDDISPENAGSALKGLGKHIGVVADLGKWSDAKVKPAEGLALVKDRLLAINVRDRGLTGTGAADVSKFLLEVSRLDPPSTPPWPPVCGNCNGPHVAFTKPLFVSLDPAGASDSFADLKVSTEAFETAVRPAMGYRVDEIARHTPISPPSLVYPEDRKKIEAALPRQAVAKPLKARKLLVVDITPNSFYHATCAYGNLALELMAKNTGAYRPIFSNDLDNLKYPKIRQFDAVFLNGIGGGEVFIDPAVLNGLMRFVREGGGLAGLHGSTFASLDVSEYGEMMGGQEGRHRCCETSTVKIDDPASPLTKAFAGKGFTWTDEFYHFPDTGPFSREKMHVLLSVDAAKSDMTEWKGIRADNEYPLSWIRSYGKGRVFNLALGHTPVLFETPAFGVYVLSAIQFVLGDLKADTTPSGKLPGEN
jgi:type 1 glutamine amidotransferase